MQQNIETLVPAATNLNKLFPVPDDNPVDLRINDQTHQSKILLNGELRDWDGPFNDVFLPF